MVQNSLTLTDNRRTHKTATRFVIKTQKGVKSQKGVNDGLEKGQQEIQKKIFEFDFLAVSAEEFDRGCWIF